MRSLLLLLLIAAVILCILALPLLAADLTAALATTEQLSSLLRLYLMTCAFVGALWAVYLKDTRLRANSDNVLVALVVFVIASSVLVVAVILAQFVPPGAATDSRAQRSESASQWARAIGFLSLEMYLAAFVTLLITVFMQTYNQLYNLRTNKFVKYFKPVRWLRNTLGPHKRYEYTMVPRTLTTADFPPAQYFGGDAELKRLNEGASILVSGRITDRVINEVLRWMMARMRKNDTANYAVADRHPIELWRMLEVNGFEDHRRDDFVLIDCYSPNFAFTDDIHEENDRLLRDKGVSCIRAKTLAGLDTANNRAFNIIKRHEQQKKRNIRRPMVMVYAHISALCEFESIEQFRVFWRHVIPSERSYGMLTFIVEDDLVGGDVLSPLRRLVDFELRASEDDNGTVTFTRPK